MEAIFAPYASADRQSIAPNYNKQMKYPSKRNNSAYARGLISRPTATENLAPSTNIIHGAGGLFFAPPARSLSFSCPPTAYAMLNPNQQQNHLRQAQQQPPLLPLPIPRSHTSLPSTPTRKANRTKDHSLTPRKSKQPMMTRKEEPKQDTKTSPKSSSFININASALPLLGPDPNDLPKDVPKVLSSSSVIAGGNGVVVNINSLGVQDFEKFTGSVFTPSPPPSSLPLPKFSIRPKVLSCTAEAAGVDAGATDNLRRILRLR